MPWFFKTGMSQTHTYILILGHHFSQKVQGPLQYGLKGAVELTVALCDLVAKRFEEKITCIHQELAWTG